MVREKRKRKADCHFADFYELVMSKVSGGAILVQGLQETAMREGAPHGGLRESRGWKPQKDPVQLVVDQFEVLYIRKVDVVNQRFEGTIHFALVIKDGWSDEYISGRFFDKKAPKQAEGESKTDYLLRLPKSYGEKSPYLGDFKDDLKSCSKDDSTRKDEDGKMHATAAWYLSKIDFPNAVQYELLECSVHKPYSRESERFDMKLWIKLKGEFVEVMEMENYPFDIQELTFTIGSQCNVNGVFPVEFIVDEGQLTDKKKISIQPDGFELVETEYTKEKFDHETGVSDTRAFTDKKVRAFPRLHIKVIVSRKSYYAVVAESGRLRPSAASSY